MNWNDLEPNEVPNTLDVADAIDKGILYPSPAWETRYLDGTVDEDAWTRQLFQLYILNTGFSGSPLEPGDLITKAEIEAHAADLPPIEDSPENVTLMPLRNRNLQGSWTNTNGTLGIRVRYLFTQPGFDQSFMLGAGATGHTWQAPEDSVGLGVWISVQYHSDGRYGPPANSNIVTVQL